LSFVTEASVYAVTAPTREGISVLCHGDRISEAPLVVRHGHISILVEATLGNKSPVALGD
jgi:hypothetical protein